MTPLSLRGDVLIKHTLTGRLRRRRYATLITALAIAAIAACGGGDATPQPAGAPVATLTENVRAPLPTRVPTPTPIPLEKIISTQEDIDRARLLMLQSFDFWVGANVIAIQEIGELGVQSSIIPMIELTRFVFEDYTITQLGEALKKLTGEEFGGADWDAWYEWLGQHPEVEPPLGYTTWKGNIYSNIDERFVDFFQEHLDTRIPMWAIQWGGVIRDGIPPLENPEIIRGAEAGYLRLDDPVFGAVVNGEARAYPWRQMASHELANDVIQGNPVTVVF